MNADLFKVEFEVRDYECDFEGIVNNAVYMNYLEHARHIFLKQHGIDFIALAKRGINLVVIHAELDYLYPLRTEDRFYVTARMERVSRIRFGFLQEIYRLADDKPILKARITGTSLNEAGRPHFPKELEELIEGAIAPKEF
jgi:acyl-CoA thioester hydrolase